MPVTFILNAGILLTFLCGIIAGWCCHHLWNDHQHRLKKCLVLLASVLAIASTPAPAFAQKTWKLISPGPCEAGSGGGSDVSGFPAATTLNPSCTSLAIGGTCSDSEGMQLFYIGVLNGKRLYGMMEDMGQPVYKSENTAGGGPSVNNGMVNTSVMTLPTMLMYYPAAVACRAMGESYYLPAKDELNLIFTNRTAINLSAKGFVITGGYSYWSSTEFDITRAWHQRLDNGTQSYTSYNKNSSTPYVRCIRR